ncbi:MAG: orotate phosphoribosyltransferase [Chitinispirillaceae bacterium]|jgi:orotate phosphoribosyltransferase|nr:orotate phosphoribosyltransferase [Chitinispirillaceae bacterium]
METYKQEFIEFMVRSGVLTFGDFTTKSGRKTPFFINTGNYRTGLQIRRLGEFYAAAIVARRTAFDVLYGPAYKGIPLVVAAASALAADHDRDAEYFFNRKEIKDHGEGGMFIGHKPVAGERVLIVEDVVTAGTAVRESAALLGPLGVVIAGLVVSVDRMERGTGELSALAELAETISLDAFAIVTIDDVVEHLAGRPVDGRVVLTDDLVNRIGEYRKQYGARDP